MSSPGGKGSLDAQWHWNGSMHITLFLSPICSLRRLAERNLLGLDLDWT